MLRQDNTAVTYQIQRYEPGNIWINKSCYPHSVIISQNRLLPWQPSRLSEVTQADFAPIFNDKPQVLLIGTGEKLIIPDKNLLNSLFAQGIGVEFMDSKAACYTFTVLVSEQRQVTACILIN